MHSRPVMGAAAREDPARSGLTISRARLEEHLRRMGFRDASVSEVRALGGRQDESLKSFGYGRPIRATFTSRGERHTIVLRTMASDPFGHDRRSDRAASLLLAFDTFHRIPKHVRPLDVGMFDAEGNLDSFALGEPYLITTYAEGDLYAGDLARLAELDVAPPLDRRRSIELARYLVELHREKAPAAAYTRSIRDTIGHGEGIFGIADAYPEDCAAAPRHRLDTIEIEAVRWRSRLRSRTHRARRIHGDFHPFNILFRNDTELSVLDASRGAAGDPADDVTCLSLNYAFFAWTGERSRFDGALRELWHAFWNTYLSESQDEEILTVVAPFFAWRALVMASPVWYPAISDDVRERLLSFAEKLLRGAPFRPESIERIFE